MKSIKKEDLKELLKMEVNRYHALPGAIKRSQGHVEAHKDKPDYKVSLDAEDIARYEKERELRAENIVKICSLLGIDMIDLREDANEADIYKKAA